MAVPFFRLELGDAEIGAVVDVLKSGWLTTGAQCKAFEEEFAAALGGGVHAIAVNSNTSGLHLALEAAGVGPGDEVIVPDLTFTATAEVVRYLGAEVVLVDVDPETLCIDLAEVERSITPRTKAVLPVHFGGLGVDLQSLITLADRHGLVIIEDAAHSFPASIDGAMIGTHGTFATVFSFYANKTMTTGEGGMVVTANADVAQRCRTMRLHGIDRDAFKRFQGDSSQWQYDIVAPGFKYNLTDIAAALGRKQLARAFDMRDRRAALAEMYRELLSDLPLKLPAYGDEGDMHGWHLFPVELTAAAQLDRSGLEAVLIAAGIGYSVHYTPLHKMTYWHDRYGHGDNRFPISSAYFERCITLPLFSAMRDEEVLEVAGCLRRALG